MSLVEVIYCLASIELISVLSEIHLNSGSIRTNSENIMNTTTVLDTEFVNSERMQEKKK